MRICCFVSSYCRRPCIAFYLLWIFVARAYFYVPFVRCFSVALHNFFSRKAVRLSEQQQQKRHRRARQSRVRIHHKVRVDCVYDCFRYVGQFERAWSMRECLSVCLAVRAFFFAPILFTLNFPFHIHRFLFFMHTVYVWPYTHSETDIEQSGKTLSLSLSIRIGMKRPEKLKKMSKRRKSPDDFLFNRLPFLQFRLLRWSLYVPLHTYTLLFLMVWVFFFSLVSSWLEIFGKNEQTKWKLSHADRQIDRAKKRRPSEITEKKIRAEKILNRARCGIRHSLHGTDFFRTLSENDGRKWEQWERVPIKNSIRRMKLIRRKSFIRNYLLEKCLIRNQYEHKTDAIRIQFYVQFGVHSFVVEKLIPSS